MSEVSWRHCLVSIGLYKTMWVSNLISVKLLMKELREQLKGTEWRQLWLLLSQPLSLF